MKKVGIVGPSYNQGRFLKTCLDSLLAQKGVEVQIALMDGGSTDETKEILACYASNCRYVRSRRDEGQSAAINEGMLHLSQCEYVGWLNSDDALAPEGLAQLAAALEQDPQASAAYGEAQFWDAENEIIGKYPTRPFDRLALAKGCFICQPATLIRREAWETLQGLREKLHMCMDYDLWWRLLKLGPLLYVPKIVAFSRDYAATKTRSYPLRHVLEAQALLEEHNGNVPWNWFLEEVVWHWKVQHQRRPDRYEKLKLLWKTGLRWLYYRRHGL